EREAEDFGCVQAAGMSISHGSPQHGRAGKVHLARLQHDRLVERMMLEAVVLAEKDAQQHRVLWYLHRLLPRYSLFRTAGSGATGAPPASRGGSSSSPGGSKCRGRGNAFAMRGGMTAPAVPAGTRGEDCSRMVVGVGRPARGGTGAT